MPISTKIPTYSADGRRLRSYSSGAIERLLSLSLCVVRRNRTGKIVAAFFRPADGANPMLATANMGQKYSYLEHVGNGRVWSHRSLIPRQDIEQLTGEPLDTPEEIDLYLRGVFRAVPLSCLVETPVMAPEPEPEQTAKIVNIADFKRRHQHHQVKVKTERRAA